MNNNLNNLTETWIITETINLRANKVITTEIM